MNAITTDAAQPLALYFRVDSVGVPISFTFVDSAGDPYTFVYDEFQLIIKPYVGSRKNTLLLGLGSGLTLASNVLTARINTLGLNILPGEYYWELYKNDYGRPWLTGPAYGVDGTAKDITETSSVTVNEGGYDVTVTINEGAVDSDEVPLETFNTELTFNYDKEFETVTGGTRTFTLAASGHLNGVGIVARINTPTAVNFPAGFEAINGSDSINVAGMNIIVFRYFEDYDGAGNGKVLYLIKNQTAL